MSNRRRRRGGGAIGGLNPVQFFLDNFTDTNAVLLENHVSDSAHAWSKVNGTGSATIQTNRIFCATAAAIYKSAAVAPSPNYYVEAVVDLVTDVADNFGPCIRLDGSANGYTVRYDQAGDTWLMAKLTAGAAAGIGASFSDNWNAGTRTVRLEAIDNNIRAYIDGTLRLSIVDNTFSAAGSPGFRWASAQTNIANRHVTSLLGFG